MLARGLLMALLFVTVAPQQGAQFPVHVESLEYPALPRMARITGDVMLAAWPDADGHVTGEPQVLTGHPLLAQTASQNLKNWRFQPGKLGEVKVAYHFVLEGNQSYNSQSITRFDLPDSVTVAARPPTPEAYRAAKGKRKKN